MPLRVRCPHCQVSLTAADDQAGLAAFCSECGGSFRMPMPGSPRAAEAVSVAANCPRCQAETAPGTYICPRCAFDVRLGKRLPLSQRLKRWRLQQWSVAVACLFLVITVCWVGWELYKLQKPAEQAVAPLAPLANQQHPQDISEELQRLFAATSPAERKKAIAGLNAIGGAATAPILEIVQSGKTGPDPKQRVLNARSAIAFVAEHGTAAALESLKRLQQQSSLRIDALAARGSLADTTATGELVATWQDLTRRRLFFEQLSRVSPPLIDGADRAAVAGIQQRADQLAESLRLLGTASDSNVVSQLLDQYFNSWSWLGQERAERFASEIWDAAKPPRDSDHDFRHRIRSARRVLDRTSKNVLPATRAAAGLVLAQCGPQYESLRKEIAAALASDLSGCTGADQQRIVWSLAKLENRRFGEFGEQSYPQDASPAVIQMVLDASTSRMRGANVPKIQSMPAPPVPVLRVVTAKRQLEESLLPQFDGDWESAERATTRWIAGDLGLTARILVYLDPAEKNPRLIPLGCAIALAARFEQLDARKKLNVWANATDQPAWIRAGASTAIAAMDARAGRDVSKWLSEIDVSVFDAPDAGDNTPPDGYWGLLIDAGGERMRAQLRAAQGTMSARVRDTLLQAAESSATRTRRGI